MNTKYFLIFYSIFTLLAVSLGFFMISEQESVYKINNLITLTDDVTELSSNYMFSIADKQLELVEYLANQDEETTEDYLETIKTEKEIRKKLKDKNSIMEDLEKKDNKYLSHSHDEISLDTILKNVDDLNNKELEIFSKIENLTKNNLPTENEKIKNEIKQLDTLYDKIEVTEQLQEFIDDHKVVNSNLRELLIIQREKTQLHLTILITLFTILSIISILKFRNELKLECKIK